MGWRQGGQVCSYKSLQNGFVHGFQTIYHALPSSWRDCRWVPNALALIGTTSTGNGLPSHVRGLLQLSTSLETLTSREVDERACSVFVDTSDEHLAAAAQPVQTSHTLSIHKTGLSDVTCFRCGSLNHLANDCMQCCSFRNRSERSAICYHLSNKTWHLMKNCLGNGKQRRNFSATLSSFKSKEVLPAIEPVVNGKKQMTLMDSGCSQSLMIELVCNSWSLQASDVLTVDGKTLPGNGVGTIMLAVDNISPVKADVLVVKSSLFGFDMLIGMDIIRMLGGVQWCYLLKDRAMCLHRNQNRGTRLQCRVQWAHQGLDSIIEMVR